MNLLSGSLESNVFICISSILSVFIVLYMRLAADWQCTRDRCVFRCLFSTQGLRPNLPLNINNSVCAASFGWTFLLPVPYLPPVYHAVFPRDHNTTQTGEEIIKVREILKCRCTACAGPYTKFMALNVYSLLSIVLLVDILEILMHYCVCTYVVFTHIKYQQSGNYM